MIQRKSVADPKKTAVDIAAELEEENNVILHRSTVSCCLSSFGLNGHIAAQKPYISAKNHASRVAFAKAHCHWTFDVWSKILFSDESKFCLFGSDGRRYVRRPSGEREAARYLRPTVKHGGGNVLVWGCFSANGLGPLVEVNGIMKAHSYKEILDVVMLPHAQNKMPKDWVFQHNNDLKHTSHVVKDFLGEQNVVVLPWPAQSPDLNPIEHLWNELGKAVGWQIHSNQDKLKAHLYEEWGKIDPGLIRTLIESMPRRCEAVIASRGLPTKY